MFINIPSISKLQWHPFTVTSSSEMETDPLSVAIQCGGSWHETLVMVSGGSGVTPFISIIREIIHQANQQQPDAAASSKLPHVLLICAFKKSTDLAVLDLLLPLSLTSSSRLPPELHLRIESYVTQDHHQQLDPAQKLIQTTWFKPDPLDSPITPILGSNSWLWLGAICHVPSLVGDRDPLLHLPDRARWGRELPLLVLDALGDVLDVRLCVLGLEWCCLVAQERGAPSKASK
ncbi:hypothetical protein NL676_016476 [Syzygium grande]|nr:hypothetical protein NL676_016476 [Syzygium grande]